MIRALVLMLALSGCGAVAAPVVQCDDHGKVVMAPGGPFVEHEIAALSSNIRLTSLRQRAQMGEQWIDPARLIKADLCP